MHDEYLWKSRTWKYGQYRLLSKIRESNKIFWVNKHASSATSELCVVNKNTDAFFAWRANAVFDIAFFFFFSFSVWSESVLVFGLFVPRSYAKTPFSDGDCWNLKKTIIFDQNETQFWVSFSQYYICLCEISPRKEVIQIYIFKKNKG